MAGDVPDNDPSVVGGTRNLEGAYKQWANKQQINPQADPYMQGWAGQAGQNQINDRAQMQQLYAHLQAQAAGGSTPQQEQQARDFQMAQQNARQVAQSQGGGGYGRAAAMGSLMGTAGITGAQQGQQAQQLKAADMIRAQQQMQQVAAMQRAQDLQAQGMTAEDAMRQAQLEAQARGMNYQGQMGYLNLMGDYNRQNMESYLSNERTNQGIYRAQKNQDTANQAATGEFVADTVGSMFMGI